MHIACHPKLSKTHPHSPIFASSVFFFLLLALSLGSLSLFQSISAPSNSIDGALDLIYPFFLLLFFFFLFPFSYFFFFFPFFTYLLFFPSRKSLVGSSSTSTFTQLVYPSSRLTESLSQSILFIPILSITSNRPLRTLLSFVANTTVVAWYASSVLSRELTHHCAFSQSKTPSAIRLHISAFDHFLLSLSVSLTLISLLQASRVPRLCRVSEALASHHRHPAITLSIISGSGTTLYSPKCFGGFEKRILSSIDLLRCGVCGTIPSSFPPAQALEGFVHVN